MSATHRIEPDFMETLKDGFLKPILDEVRVDATLMLGLRRRCVTVYYRGCSLLRLEALGERHYTGMFDSDYAPDSDKQLLLKRDWDEKLFRCDIADRSTAEDCVSSFGVRKQLIDRHLGFDYKNEREFQQLVVRENNRSSVANETEYFITDIEHAHADARFDMLAVRWLQGHRKKGNALRPVFIEMKFGAKALGGSSGLKEHLRAMSKRLCDPEVKEGLLANIESQFEQLTELELIRFNRSDRIERFEVDRSARPLVVLLLASYNPRSAALQAALADIREMLKEELPFDLRFFVATFAGYAMHDAAMLTFEEFAALVDQLRLK